MLLSEYVPSKLVLYLHSIPRGGFPNQIPNYWIDEEWSSYLIGVLLASSLFTCIGIFWATLLLLLKVSCGVRRVGCAAGGAGVVNVQHLRDGDEQLSKTQRKRRIRRYWRLQSVALFICASMVLPINYVMVQKGLRPWVVVVEELRQVNDQMESIAYRALHITEQMDRAHERLLELPMETFLNVSSSMCSTLEMASPSININTTVGSTNETAANATLSSTNKTTVTHSSSTLVIENDEYGAAFGDVLDLFVEWQEKVVVGMNVVKESFAHLESTETSLYTATNITSIVEQVLDGSLEYDWVLKMGLLVLDVMCLFWVFALLVAQNSIDWPALQRIAAALLLPVLCLLFVFFLGVSLVLAGASLVNADFCAGTEITQSPLGVLEHAFAMENNSVFARVFDYYQSDCLATNPFEALETVEIFVIESDNSVNSLQVELNAYAELIPTVCATNNTFVSSANETLVGLREILYDLQGNLAAALKLSECSNIGPILRRLLYGATCDEFTQTLVYLTASAMATTVLLLLILSTRAAVFSPVIRGRLCKRREKEFEDYKNYMSRFYDTKNWTLDFIPPDKEDLAIRRTDTRSTASPASEGSDTVVAQVTDDDVQSLQPDDEDDDSYDSTYSTDDDEDEEGTTFSTMSQFYERHRAMLLNNSMSSTTSTQLSRFKEGGQKFLSLFVKDRYSHPIDEEEDEEEENEISFDTTTMLTPQPLRYTTARYSRSSNKQKKRGDPEDFEMIALSPKVTTTPSNKRSLNRKR